MLKKKRRTAQLGRQAGLSMIEVLLSILVMSVGLLGMASLQSKAQNSELEAFQRAQALLALGDMGERISANRANATSYLTLDTVGTGDAQPVSCGSIPPGPARDMCEWSNVLKGASESSGTTFAMRGCVTQLQAANVPAGTCQPAIYEVTVTWQGLTASAVPAQTCGAGLYGTNDAFRRAVSTQVAVAAPSC